MAYRRVVQLGSLFLLLALLAPAAMAQEGEYEVIQEVRMEPAPADPIFVVVEEMPEFPGGQEELFKFLATNIAYPAEALDVGISGVVYVTFVVEIDGRIADVRVLRGIGGGCDEESVRVVRTMPPWTPARQRGKPVRVQYNIPIRYTL